MYGNNIQTELKQSVIYYKHQDKLKFVQCVIVICHTISRDSYNSEY